MRVRGDLVLNEYCELVENTDQWIDKIKEGFFGVQSGNHELILFCDKEGNLRYLSIESDINTRNPDDIGKLDWAGLVRQFRDGRYTKYIFNLDNIQSRRIRSLLGLAVIKKIKKICPVEVTGMFDKSLGFNEDQL